MIGDKSTSGKGGADRRAAALPTVLALVSAVLVAGLAMGSLSTLSLQFNRRQMDTTRAEMAARSGLAYFLSRTQQFEAGEEQEINPLDPQPISITVVVPERRRSRIERAAIARSASRSMASAMAGRISASAVNWNCGSPTSSTTVRSA